MKNSASLVLASTGFLFAAFFLFSCGEPLEVPVSDGVNQTGDGESVEQEIPTIDEEVPEELEVQVGAGDLLLESAAIGLEHDGELSERTSFDIGDPLVARIIASEVPKGLVGRIEWKQDDEVAASEQKPIPEDSRTVSFSMPESIEPGTYTVELYLGGNQVHSAEIRID